MNNIKMLMYINTFVLLAFLSSGVLANNSPNAKDVMLKVDSRYEGDTRRQVGTMILLDKDKNKRVREFVELSKTHGDVEKSLSRVLQPSELSGTAFLSYEWNDSSRDDESWLYLPQLKKIKRLATTDRSSYFLGSDFTYADLIGLEVEHFDYAFSEDNNDELWVINATPKKQIREEVINETGYKSVKYWVDKEKFMVVKAQYWLDEGNKIKYLTISYF